MDLEPGVNSLITDETVIVHIAFLLHEGQEGGEDHGSISEARLRDTSLFSVCQNSEAEVT